MVGMVQSGCILRDSCRIRDGWEVRHTQDAFLGHSRRTRDGREVRHSCNASQDTPAESGTVLRYGTLRMHPRTLQKNLGRSGGTAQSGCIPGNSLRIRDDWEVWHSSHRSPNLPEPSFREAVKANHRWQRHSTPLRPRYT